MASDIVERLREQQFPPGHVVHLGTLCYDAAVEIEQLRASNERLADGLVTAAEELRATQARLAATQAEPS